MDNKKFNYTFSELRRFIELGKREDNVDTYEYVILEFDK